MALNANRQVKELLGQVGQAGLNLLYPEEFEYYLMALELVDSSGKVVEYFVFPVMPESISKKSASLLNVKKTFGGVVALDTDQFIPIDYEISGSFGRKLRFVIANQSVNTSSLAFSFDNAVKSFSTEVKTGYGSCKVLENIMKKSSALDSSGNPYTLHMYNPAFGESFVVKIQSYTFKQDLSSSNMIWNYQVSIKALAQLNNQKSKLTTLFTFDFIKTGLNSGLSSLKSLLR